jgi:uncharacterized membrane protein
VDRPPADEPPSVDRLAAFSDGVFAIAITLLILPLTEAQVRDTHVLEDLLALEPQFLALVLSFAVIGRFWLLHHEDLRQMTGATQRVLVANLVFLFFVVVLPFPTALLGDGDSATATIIYALAIIGTSLSSLGVWLAAEHDGVIPPEVHETTGRLKYYGTAGVVLGFVPSLPLAFVNEDWARYSWLLAIPFSWIAGRLEMRRRPAHTS